MQVFIVGEKKTRLENIKMHLIDKHHADAIQRCCTKVFVHKTFFNFKCLEKKGKKKGLAQWHLLIWNVSRNHRKTTHISVKREQLDSLLSWHCILILLIPGNLLGRLIVQSWGPATVPGIATMKTPNYTNCNQNVNHRKKAANRQAQLDLTCIIERNVFHKELSWQHGK